MILPAGHAPPACRLGVIGGKHVVIVAEIELRFRVPGLRRPAQVGQTAGIVAGHAFTGEVTQRHLEIPARILHDTQARRPAVVWDGEALGQRPAREQNKQHQADADFFHEGFLLGQPESGSTPGIL